MKQFNNQNSFTLLELLIVVAIIGLLAAAVLFLINPFQQIYKSWDAKRRQELSTLQKTFDDYYNDKNYYPGGSDVCYDSDDIVQEGDTCSCHICGMDPNTPSFSPYLNRLPCDPQHSSDKNYLYQYNCDTKQWYKIYTSLSDVVLGGGYNYGVSSGNVPVEPYPSTTAAPTAPPGPGGPTDTPAPPSSTPAPSPTTSPNQCPADSDLWCYQTIGYAPEQLSCNFCFRLVNCKAGQCDQPWHFFTNSGCTVPCEP